MRAWVALGCSAEATWREVSRDPRQSRVFAVTDGPVTRYVKTHQSAGKYRRERDGLRGLAGLDLAPELIAARDDLHTLVIAACSGLDPRPIAADWRAAGAALRRLHRMPCPNDPLPLCDAVGRRLAGWRRRAHGLLPPTVIEGLAAQVGDGAAFVGAERVFCHRDFTPQNWRVSGGRCRVFDLEHAGPDAAEADLVKLYAEPFAAHPALEAAFVAGYGTGPDPDRLRALLALHALATLTWGHLHDDPGFVERGDRLASRLLGSPLASR